MSNGSSTPPRRGRPLGEKALAVMRSVEYAPRTVAELAHGLQLSYRDALRTVHRLAQSGHVSYGAAQAGNHDRPARLVHRFGAAARAPQAGWIPLEQAMFGLSGFTRDRSR